MRSQKPLKDAGLTDEPIGNPREWNKSLISRNLVRREYVPYPAESENHCQKRMMVSFCVFLAVIAILAAAVVMVIWAKIHGII